LPLRLPAPPIPEGALFIDPFESTRGEGVFRGGPEFEYDATTGSLSVFAPPMLGPADEFGIRQQYSPQSIKLFGREFFSDSPSIPKISRYRRNKFEYSRFNSQPVPFDEGDPSFVMDENSDSFGLYISPENIQVNASWGRELSAAEVDFSSLLMPGLNAEVFAAEEGPILPNSIWPYLPNIKESLPDVYFVVDYTVSNYFVRNLGSSGSYSLLAVPQAGLFQNRSQAPLSSHALQHSPYSPYGELRALLVSKIRIGMCLFLRVGPTPSKRQFPTLSNLL